MCALLGTETIAVREALGVKTQAKYALGMYSIVSGSRPMKRLPLIHRNLMSSVDIGQLLVAVSPADEARISMLMHVHLYMTKLFS